MTSRTARRPVRSHPLARFVAATFGFSWLLWLLPALSSRDIVDLPETIGLLGLVAPFGPGFAAMWLVWGEKGGVGVQELWLRAWRIRFHKKWLIPALGLGPAVALGTLAIVTATGRAVDWGAAVPLPMTIPVFAFIYLTNALPEEYGWRGYALDPLQRRFGALGASLTLGLVWGLWHLPLVFIEGSTQATIPFPEFVSQTMLLAVVYTWLHNNTGGSVLVAALFHASANMSAAVIPTWTSQFGRWTSFGILSLVTGAIVWRAGWRRLTRRASSGGFS